MKRLCFALTLLTAAVFGTEVNLQDPIRRRDNTGDLEFDAYKHKGRSARIQDDSDHDSDDHEDIEPPDYFGKAVSNFDIADIFIDEECYQKQIDIYSDQLVAVEALRRTIVSHMERVDEAEEKLGINNDLESNNRRDDNEIGDRCLEQRTSVEVLSIDHYFSH